MFTCLSLSDIMDGTRQNWRLADSLGSVRAEIKALKTREAELRKAILASPVSEDGVEFRVIIRRGTAKRFNRDALPAHILNDPRYWTERATLTVMTQPLGQGRGNSHASRAERVAPLLTDEDEEFDVIEDI